MKIEEKNIDELLIAYLLQELDEETILSVEEWIKASPENQSSYQKIKRIWEEAETSNLKFDNQNAWKNVSKQIYTKEGQRINIQKDTYLKKNNKVVLFKPWMGIAASILVLVAAFFMLQNKNQIEEATVVFAEASPINTTLLDGSKIELNTNTKISYTTDFNKYEREINLEGEAFFDIKRDVTKTFIIHTTDSKVEVLGTSFNINDNHKDSLITVFVKSGLVRFSYLAQDTIRAYQVIELSAGKKVIYNKNSRKIQLSNDASYNQIDAFWRDNKLSFDGIKLGKVAKILEIVFDVKIVLLNENLNNCQITVGFDNDGIDQIMEVIASTFNMDINRTDNTFILKGEACEDK